MLSSRVSEGKVRPPSWEHNQIAFRIEPLYLRIKDHKLRVSVPSGGIFKALASDFQ